MRILAIDPGSMLGFATDATGRLEWGTENFRLRPKSTEAVRWHAFRRWFAEKVQACGKSVYVVYEEQNNFNRGNSSSGELGKIFSAFMLEYCHERGIPCEAVPNSTLKRFALPALPRAKKGEPKHPPLDRSKAAMIEAAVRRLSADCSIGIALDDALPGGIVNVKTYGCISEHEADALFLYWLASKHIKGVN